MRPLLEQYYSITLQKVGNLKATLAVNCFRQVIQICVLRKFPLQCMGINYTVPNVALVAKTLFEWNTLVTYWLWQVAW